MAVQITRIALAGNPNVGKSTIFNALTGSRQHVGNWPGKTVEKKEGHLRLDGQDIVVVDLPGTYSLTAYSIEEIISRDFIVNEHPGVVVAVVDASNLERNLYLVTQLLELETPLIIALNMSDIARSRGLKIEPSTLSRNLGGIPVIETIGSHGIGIDALKDAIVRAVAHHEATPPLRIDYDTALENEIDHLAGRIEHIPALAELYLPRWLAIKLLEDDEDITQRLQAAGHDDLLDAAQDAMARIEEATGEDAETLITDRRYAFIGAMVTGALSRPRAAMVTRSDQIDRVLTDRLWGVPIFLLLMWIVFQFTANVSAPFLEFVEEVIGGPITRWIAAVLGAAGMGGTWFESLLLDGVVAGVGAVMVFIPVLMSLYFAIGLLEDSGYMARAAFVMDRVMRALGLHGKSFLPMLVGFGCTVPAVFATRTLENEDDRKLTGFLVTFMSCGARLPVYVIIGAAFFGASSGNLIFGMYLLGIAVALLTGLVMKRLLYRHKPPQPFVMELPPYRLPRMRDIWRQTWERTSSFVRKAGTIILVTSVIIWFLLAIPAGSSGSFNDVEAEDSLFGAVSSAIAPVFAPAGFDTWQSTGSLISGFVAKEVIVGTMGLIFLGPEFDSEGDEPAPSFGEDLREIGTAFLEAAALTGQEIVNIAPRTVNIIPGVSLPELELVGGAAEDEAPPALQTALTNVFTPLSAVAFTVFVLLYTPCMATVAAMRQEFGPRWTLYQIVYTAVIAWAAAVIVYQGGTLLGWGA
jgi:ferrous iron transport protein B